MSETLNNDLLNMTLGERAFGDADNQGGTGFRFLGTIVSFQVVEGFPDRVTQEPTQQIKYLVQPMGWYKENVLIHAPAESKARHEWARISLNKAGQINKRSKMGIIMQAFGALFGELKISELEGKEAWFELMQLEFGTDREGKKITSGDTLMPVGLPAEGELAFLKNGAAAPAAAQEQAPSPELAYTDQEIVVIASFLIGRKTSEAQLAALSDPVLTAGMKHAVLSGRAVKALLERGIIKEVDGIIVAP